MVRVSCSVVSVFSLLPPVSSLSSVIFCQTPSPPPLSSFCHLLDDGIYEQPLIVGANNCAVIILTHCCVNSHKLSCFSLLKFLSLEHLSPWHPHLGQGHLSEASVSGASTSWTLVKFISEASVPRASASGTSVSGVSVSGASVPWASLQSWKLLRHLGTRCPVGSGTSSRNLRVSPVLFVVSRILC